MSDSIVAAACVVIGIFAAALYLWTAWPIFFGLVAAVLPGGEDDRQRPAIGEKPRG
jgi:hypothetical protein